MTHRGEGLEVEINGGGGGGWGGMQGRYWLKDRIPWLHSLLHAGKHDLVTCSSDGSVRGSVVSAAREFSC